MKQFLVKRAAVAALAALSIPATLWAQQKETSSKKEDKEVQRITIVREKKDNEETVIEIKGDKVLVNGKEAKDTGNVQVYVNTTKSRNGVTFYRNGNTWQGDNNFNFDLNRGLNIDLNNDANSRISLFSEDANRAMLGVVTDEDERGAKIASITRESSADKAGLKVGDVITKIGDANIDDAEDVATAVHKHKPGDKVTVSFLRGGKEQKITAELGKWKGVRINSLNATIAPMEPLAPVAPFRNYSYSYGSSSTKLGLSVQDTDDGKGVKVLQVAEESSAEKAGIKKDDVITRINDEDVNSTDEVKEVMREARNEASVKMQVLRNGKTQTIDVRFPRKLKTTDL